MKPRSLEALSEGTKCLNVRRPRSGSCGNASSVSVVPEVFVSACVEDCGTYGECRLLRSYSYLYAACVCKAGTAHSGYPLCARVSSFLHIMGCLPAGWSGWGCTDDTTAQSFGRQLAAVLLLTLSNLSFLPAIVVAGARRYITEASVYVFTMFFSTVTDTVQSGDQPEPRFLVPPLTSCFDSSTTRAISRASRSCASWTTTRSSTATSWAQSAPSGSPSSAWRASRTRSNT